MSSYKSKLAVVAEVYSPNLGDGLIYQIVSEGFSNKDIEVVPVDLSLRNSEAGGSESPSDVRVSGFKTAMRILLIRYPWIRRMLAQIRWRLHGRSVFRAAVIEKIRDCDGVVIGGGQLLNDTNLNFPLRIDEVVRLAKFYDKPVAFFGVGVGKQWSRAARIIYNRALRGIKFVSVRDYVSQERLISRTNCLLPIYIHPDPVFCLGAEPSGSLGAPSIPAVSLQCGETVGLNVMSFSIFQRFVSDLRDVGRAQYFRFWRRLSDALMSEGLIPKIFVTGGHEDWNEARSLHRYLSDQGIGVTLEPRPKTPDELVALLKSFDFVVATRLHAGITGFALGKAVATISWDDKVKSVWEEAGFDPVVSPGVMLCDDPWPILRGALVKLDFEEKRKESLAEAIEVALDRCLKDIYKSDASGTGHRYCDC